MSLYEAFKILAIFREVANLPRNDHSKPNEPTWQLYPTHWIFSPSEARLRCHEILVEWFLPCEGFALDTLPGSAGHSVVIPSFIPLQPNSRPRKTWFPKHASCSKYLQWLCFTNRGLFRVSWATNVSAGTQLARNHNGLCHHEQNYGKKASTWKYFLKWILIGPCHT